MKAEHIPNYSLNQEFENLEVQCNIKIDFFRVIIYFTRLFTRFEPLILYDLFDVCWVLYTWMRTSSQSVLEMKFNKTADSRINILRFSRKRRRDTTFDICASLYWTPSCVYCEITDGTFGDLVEKKKIKKK